MSRFTIGIIIIGLIANFLGGLVNCIAIGLTIWFSHYIYTNYPRISKEFEELGVPKFQSWTIAFYAMFIVVYPFSVDMVFSFKLVFWIIGYMLIFLITSLFTGFKPALKQVYCLFVPAFVRNYIGKKK